MGHNRAGVRRKLRLRRRKREGERLAERSPREGEGAAPAAEGKPHGILETVKDAARSVVDKVAGLLPGHSEKPSGAPPEAPS